MFSDNSQTISLLKLKCANYFNLLLLTKYIGLTKNLNKMSHKQLARLVYWRLTRREY